MMARKPVCCSPNTKFDSFYSLVWLLLEIFGVFPLIFVGNRGCRWRISARRCAPPSTWRERWSKTRHCSSTSSKRTRPSSSSTCCWSAWRPTWSSTTPSRPSSPTNPVIASLLSAEPLVLQKFQSCYRNEIAFQCRFWRAASSRRSPTRVGSSNTTSRGSAPCKRAFSALSFAEDVQPNRVCFVCLFVFFT